MKPSINCLVLALSSLVTLPAHADNYALVMGVSEYVRSPLAGVRKDIVTATALAKQMGVPEENITVRRDQELTLGGLRQSLKSFNSRIKAGDRVFIYYSGHGTSFSKSDGQCQKAIVTQEMEVMPREEFHALLDPIIQRAAKTFVMLDTCFSGGVVAGKGMTRDAGASGMQAKFTSSSADDPCAQPTNYGKGTRDFAAEAATTPNYYLLGAAGPSEHAIDGGSSTGGLATTAFYQCTQPGSGADKDGDGVISLQEARRCAQDRVDQMVRPPFAGQTLTEGNGPGGNTPVSFVAGGGTGGSTGSSGANPNQRINSMALLETLRQGADARRQVTVTPTQQRFRINTDFLGMEVRSSKAGYVTLFSVGSSGKIFQLFPNSHDSDNRIEAGVSLQLPRDSWKIRARGPAGTDRFLAVVSDTPNRFANLGLPAGPFAQVENKAASAKDMVERLIAPAGNCSHANQRSVRDFDAEPNDCATGYGAGMMEVQEVE